MGSANRSESPSEPSAARESAAHDSRLRAHGSQPLRILVYHHTHWDREWWATYQDFRIRLVEVIDVLLDTLDRDPRFRSFLLDGQTIVLRDYLEVRPDEESRLTGWIRAGRIDCGPWYILPDEFLVSGEAHIRNLWLGRRIASRLAIPLQQVGYLPDTFGHIAQMPQILRGFGIDNAFIWRGYSPESCEPRTAGSDPEVEGSRLTAHSSQLAPVWSEFRWEAPDGSAVLTHWFPEGYYQMPFLHFGNPARPYEDRVGRIFRAIERWGPLAATNVLLLPYGGDHRPIDPRLPEKIEEANEAIAGLGRIRWGTLSEYAEEMRASAGQLGTVRGELRALGRDHPHLLSGVLSTRMYLKQRNFEGQSWLERYAEPLSAVAWLAGRRYDADLLWKAWEYLVQNHPHDSICGCSIDQVHREMLPRFDQSRQIAEIVSEQCTHYLNSGIEWSGYRPGDQMLVARNTLAWLRSGLVTVLIPRSPVEPRTHCLITPSGEEVPFQTRDVEATRPMTDRSDWTEVNFIAPDVLGLGHAAFRLTPRESPLDAKLVNFAALGPAAFLKGSTGETGATPTDLKIGPGLLENAHLRVEVDPRDGTLEVTDLASGHTYKGLHSFDDGGDAGDTYNYSAPLGDQVLHSAGRATVHLAVTEAGPARATLRVSLDWQLPVSLTSDRSSRSSEMADTRISSYISLASGSRAVEITTEWENRSQDHRLRALFRLGSPVAYADVQGQFAVNRRPVATANPGSGWPETYAPTMPQQGWVSVCTEGRGLLVANRGLPEYEVLDDGRGTIALTLLRAVGWLSRDDLLARVGGAGPTTPTPDAQCLGLNRVSYAIIPHRDDWLSSGAYRAAEEYLFPLHGSSTSEYPVPEPAESRTAALSDGLIELEESCPLLLTAVKKSERDNLLVLRFWNVTAEPVEARIAVRRAIAEARLLDLKEEAIDAEPLPSGSDWFRLRAGPAGIITLGLRFDGAGTEM